MARFKVSITKFVQFQGKEQEFANVYTYETGALDPNFTNLVNDIVTAEKRIFSSAVGFRRAQVWDAGIPPNVMRHTQVLSGVGALGVTDMYRECALLVKWPLPRAVSATSSRQRSLKKYLHICSSAGGSANDGNTLIGAPAAGSALALYMAAVTDPPNVDADLVSPSGAVPNGPPVVHPYLEHRQFPRGRKESSGIL